MSRCLSTSIPLLVGTALAAALALPVQAQSVPYKVVAPDGSVTYTDRPPASLTMRVTRLGVASGPEPTAAAEVLDPALRKAMQRYPVTLYAAPDCAPCDAGRQLLHQRGVPYTEKRVVTDDDATELERNFGARTVPALTIGTQVLFGMSAPEWSAYLDAAGYGRESQLPKGWQPRPSTPAATTARASTPPAAALPPPAAPAARPQAPSGPPEPIEPALTGIRF